MKTSLLIYIKQSQRVIRSRIVNHLMHCEGNAVIVFDEVQKVLPGTLEVGEKRMGCILFVL